MTHVLIGVLLSVLPQLSCAETSETVWAGELRAISQITDGQLTYAGTLIPPKVKETLADAAFRGSRSYDILELSPHKRDGFMVGEFFGFPYPLSDPLDPESTAHMAPTESLSFTHTELVASRLAQEMRTEAVRVAFTLNARGVTMGNALLAESGTNLPVYNPQVWPFVGPRLIWLRSGSRFASNFVVLDDGSIHLMPASRRHEKFPDRVLMTPALARGKRVLIHGQLGMRKGEIQVIEIGTTLSRRMIDTNAYFLNPRAVFEAWGFPIAEDFELRAGARGHVVEIGPVIRVTPWEPKGP